MGENVRRRIIKLMISVFVVGIVGNLCIGMNVLAEEADDEAEVLVEESVPEEQDLDLIEQEISENSNAVKDAAITVTVNENVSSGKCGDNLEWEFEDGVLTISGNGVMYGRFDSDAHDLWNFLQQPIVSVVIKEGVTSIGSDAFYRCTNLKKVTIPNSVTSIEVGAFEYCTSLESMTIPDSVTSIGSSAFYGCTSLKSVTIPESMTSIEAGAFYGCTSLESVTFSDALSVIGDIAFADCNSLTDIIIPESVRILGKAAFDGCISLTDISIPESVQEIGDYAFRYCSGLTDIIVPGSVQEVGTHAFEGCVNLKNVTILDGVGRIGTGAFSNCFRLENVSMPASVEEIGYNAFSGCRRLKDIVVPRCDYGIRGATFAYCDNLKNVTISEGVESIGWRAFFECNNLKNIVIPESVEWIGESAFSPCEGFSITILNRDCRLDEQCLTRNEDVEGNTIIYGYSGSTAEEYANKYDGFVFVALDAETNDDNEPVKVDEIKLSGISGKIAAGKKIKLTAQISPSNASDKALKWKSSNSKVAIVNSQGVVTMKKGSGGKTVTITAVNSSGIKGTYKIRSMKGVVKKVSVSGKKSVKAGKSLKLKSKVAATKNANKKLKWKSSNAKYAKVNQSGKVTAYKTGKGKKVTITAMATDGSNKKKSVVIKIR